MGAVMGAKRIKAVVIDPGGGETPAVQQEETFAAAKKDFLRELMAHPQTKTYADYGTAALVMMTETFGGLPTRNFSSGHFEGAEKISGEALRDLLLSRGKPSETTHACMAGCVIRCSNIVADEHGKQLVAPLEYETIALTGSNLGLDDLDTISRLNWEMNDIGVDTIETGAALGVAAEAGCLRFGDADGIFAMIDEMRKGTPLGRILASGATTTGRVLGVGRVPAVKGQAMAAYDPRAIKGTGVTYATSPQGADHTAALTIRAQVDHRDPSIQGELSRKIQINNAGYDTLGVCLFAGFGFAKVPGTIPELLKAAYGVEISEDALQQLGRETLRMEKAFNRAAGLGPAHDRIPYWMTKEPLPPTGSVFDVSEQDLDKAADW
jgi:aldehyde:ferredoxin oxidoreductase